MDVANDIGLSQTKQIIITFEVSMPVSKAVTAKIIFLQCMALDHSTHGAIQN